MTWPPPSTVVMEAGTVRDVVTSPQSAVNVNVVPLIVPAQTVVISPPGIGAAEAAGANATTTTINTAPSSPTPTPHTRTTRALLRQAKQGTTRSERPDDCELGRITTAHP